MPQDQNQTNPTVHREGVDDANRVLDFVIKLDTWLGNPVRNLFRQKAIKILREQKYGEWTPFIYDDERKIYFNPVLTISSFSRYLESCKNAFQPEGQCEATVPWAQFLHGLGITPSKNIVSKTPAASGDDIILRVEGEVICHVINLLQTNLQSNTAKIEGYHTTSIGYFYWKQGTEKNDCSLSYTPYCESELAARHEFFPRWSKGDPTELMAAYRLSLRLGTSHAQLYRPPHTTPLYERLEKLSESSALLQAIPTNTKRPVFLTGRWVEDGERVYRRAVGGEQWNEIFEDSRGNLNHDSSYGMAVAKLEEGLKSPPPHSLSYLDDRYSPGLMPGLWGDPRSPGFAEARSALEDTLLRYGREPRESWKYALYLCREHILRILWKNITYVVDPEDAIIVVLDSTAALWDGTNLRLDHHEH